MIIKQKRVTNPKLDTDVIHTVGITKYKGYKIWELSSGERITELDKDSVLDSLKDAKKFIDTAIKRHMNLGTSKGVMKKVKTPRKGREFTRSNFRAKNPSEAMQEAMELNERFHGRPTREIIDLIQDYNYVDTQGVLAELIELMLVVDEKKGLAIPIHFGGKNEKTWDDSRPKLTGRPGGHQLYIVDTPESLGSQELDLSELGIPDNEIEGKQYIVLGGCFSVSYFTDKHHLEGPKSQAKGDSYEHEFGEEDGELPTIVYDTLNSRIMLVGGTYTVEAEGIRN